jgi:hypothetical protein
MPLEALYFRKALKSPEPVISQRYIFVDRRRSILQHGHCLRTFSDYDRRGYHVNNDEWFGNQHRFG